MIPKGRKQVLKVFHDAPDREFHIREVARRADIPVDNAHRYLYELARREFLKRRKDGKFTLFGANLQNTFLRKFFEYIELEKTLEFFRRSPHITGLEGVTRDILENTDGVEMIFLFASTSDMLVVVSDSVKRPFADSKVIKSVTLGEFRDLLADKKFFKKFFEEKITLYNEFLFWREIAGLINQHRL